MFLTPLRRVWLCRGTSVVHRRGRLERLNCSRAVLYTSSSVLRLDGRRVLSGLAPPPLADEGRPSRLVEHPAVVQQTTGHCWRTVHAARAARRETRVGASGRPRSHAARRSRLSAAAIATCWRRALARPR